MNIYERAERFGVQPECTCVGIGMNEWERLMKGHTRANQRKVVKIAMKAGIITEEDGRAEIKRSGYNPYVHYKTKTHIIYVHSSIEHFIRVND